MKFSQLINQSKNKEKARRIIFLLSHKIKSLEDYILHKNHEIDFNLNEFKKYIDNDAKPIERILKKTYFYGHEFILMDNVFSPRNETEIVTESLIEEMDDETNYIDICCGTGAIGISAMIKKPNIFASFLDISEHAIENTKQNLIKHNLKAKLIIQDDWLNHLKDHNYETISANFPYIGESDPINGNILKYDPKISLFAKNEGWYHYQKLLEHMEKNNFWKLIVLECNPFHSSKWIQIKEKYTQWSFKFKSDYNNHLRVAIIKRNNLS